MTLGSARHHASFRDPSGFVFQESGRIYRQVNPPYIETYLDFATSGLKAHLEGSGQLLKAWLSDHAPIDETVGAKVFECDRLAMWSYPYEWCFSQLKAAAFLTLELARSSLEFGFVLKDASAFNVQFVGGAATFVDLLSFDRYVDGTPWIAYRQFCQHFLAPLALQAWVDPRLGQLMRLHLDGIPLDLAASLMPAAARLRPGLAAHLFLHAKSTNQPAQKVDKAPHLSKLGFLALLDSLKGLIESLKWEPKQTEWGDYYTKTNYSDDSLSAKKALVREYISLVPEAKTAWDLGSNDGTFSQLLAGAGLDTVAWDIDPAAAEKGFLSHRGEAKAPLNLLLDLANPTPALGWAHSERESFLARGPVDIVMALALIHHLRIGNNTPLTMIADLFSKIGRWAIVEFVPKEDSQVQRLLASRPDIFTDYDQVGFELAMSNRFEIRRQEVVPGTVRTLYLLERR